MKEPISKEFAKKQIETLLKISPVINGLSDLYNNPEKCDKELIFNLVADASMVADELITSIAEIYPDLDPHINIRT